MATKMRRRRRSRLAHLKRLSWWRAAARKSTTSARNWSRETWAEWTGQVWCGQCRPRHWVRKRDWDTHFQQVVLRIKQEQEARKRGEEAVKEAERIAAREAQRQQRPRNQNKAPATDGGYSLQSAGTGNDLWRYFVANLPAEGSGAAAPTRTNGRASGNGTSNSSKEQQVSQPTTNGQQRMSAAENIAAAFRIWARQTPPSIPAARADARAMADSYRQVADAIRMRIRLEAEQNKLPEAVLEPLQQAATALSRLGDQHMEVVRRIEVRYGQTAEMLARPDTPSADYLKQGR